MSGAGLYIKLAGAGLIVALALSTCHYRDAANSAQSTLDTERKAWDKKIQAQTERADNLTATVATLNRKIEDDDKARKAQNEADSLAARTSPVRVRIVRETAKQCAVPNDQPASAGDSTNDTSTASGVLPQVNSERLDRALSEVEQMSSAYAACRPLLMTVIDMLNRSADTQ